MIEKKRLQKLLDSNIALFHHPFNFKLIFILSIILFPSIFSLAKSNQPVKPDGNGLPYNQRKVDSTFFEEYLNDIDFYYDREYKRPLKDTWLRRLFERFSKLFKGLGKVITSPISKYVFLILLAALLIFLIIGTKFYKVFYTSQNLENISYTEQEVEDAPLDLDNAIQEEIQNKNYRKAIRYYYIKLIRQLDRNNFIEYSKNKTNRDYYHELSDMSLKGSFLDLTIIYNDIWYGNKGIGSIEFDQYSLQFNNVFGRING